MISTVKISIFKRCATLVVLACLSLSVNGQFRFTTVGEFRAVVAKVQGKKIYDYYKSDKYARNTFVIDKDLTQISRSSSSSSNIYRIKSIQEDEARNQMLFFTTKDTGELQTVIIDFKNDMIRIGYSRNGHIMEDIYIIMYK
jgi:hypothetical protein